MNERVLTHLPLEAATWTFELYLKARGLSPLTIAKYHADLQRLRTFLANHRDAPTCWHEVTRAHLRDYLTMTVHRLAPSTRCALLSRLSRLFLWLEREGRILVNPARGLGRPRAERRLIRVLTVRQAIRLVQAPDELLDWRGARDRALLELAYSSGLRAAELVAVDVGDLDGRGRFLRVTGSRARVIPVGRPALAALRSWVRVRDRAGTVGDALFLGPGGRLKVRALPDLVERYCQRADLHTVTPHCIRASCAAHMLGNGADLRAVQEILGHASILTTQRYQYLTPEELRRVYERYHPHA